MADAPDPGLTYRVLYDGNCGFCKWMLAGLLRWDSAGRLEPIAIQDAGPLLADLSEEQRLASWHLVLPDGSRQSGGDAVAPLLRLLPGGRAPAGVFGALPRVTDHGYRWVATHRVGLSRWVPSGSKRRAAERVRAREHRGDRI